MSEPFESHPTDIIEATDELYWSDPVLWVRAAIGVETGRASSEIDNLALADRYKDGGFAEWDPRVAQAVRDYLKNVGFLEFKYRSNS